MQLFLINLYYHANEMLQKTITNLVNRELELLNTYFTVNKHSLDQQLASYILRALIKTKQIVLSTSRIKR